MTQSAPVAHDAEAAGHSRSRRVGRYWPFLVPALIGVAALIVVPLGFTVYYSLRNFNLQVGSDAFIGLSNYVDLFSGSDNGFLMSVVRTIVYVTVVIVADFVLAMTQALLVDRMKPLSAKIWRGIFILPILIIPAASAVFWRMIMYAPGTGAFLKVLGLSGIVDPPLGDSQLAFAAILITVIWAWSPWVFVLFSAGLDQIDRSVIEAAKVDGASYWQRLRMIILPLMKPLIFVTLSFKALDSFLSFEFIWVMTQGGPGGSTHNLSTFIYERAFSFLNYGSGSAMAIVMLLMTTVLSIAAVLVWQRSYGKESQQ